MNKFERLVEKIDRFRLNILKIKLELYEKPYSCRIKFIRKLEKNKIIKRLKMVEKYIYKYPYIIFTKHYDILIKIYCSN